MAYCGETMFKKELTSQVLTSLWHSFAPSPWDFFFHSLLGGKLVLNDY